MEDRSFGRRYRVTEKIGSGGMADVYKAVDEVLGRTVAVKVMHERYAADPAFVKRFRQEAQAAANLSHPSIVNIYDWGMDGETYYIVMEYVRGTDLKSLVEERGAVSADDAAEWGAQVCSALSVAHGYDIIHRDIKPQNIVLTPDGTVKVMDFGIARAGGTTLTQTGSVLGTAHYVSPEQAQGRTLSPASDLYSLGVVLYELTTGRLPFDADTPVAVALKHVNDEPAPPRIRKPDLPPAMEAVILRAMEKDPMQRYHAAEEMRRDLRRVSAGQPVEAAPRMGDTSVLPAVTPSAPEAETVRVDRPRPKKRSRLVWAWVGALALVAVVALGGAWALGAFDTSIQVPGLSGMTPEEAKTQLEAVGLVLGSVESTFSTEVPSGRVFLQTPEAGERVARASSVTIVVSRGVEQIKVPDLTGKTEEEAIGLLENAGLQLAPRIVREFNKDVPQLVVIRTDPKAGTMVNKGARVTLVVSQGVENREVPDVVGLTESQAKSRLEAQGFKVKVTRSSSDDVAKGRVIAQEPTKGVLDEVGSTVTIIVSTGVEEIEVPNVIDMTDTAAVAALEALGLQVTATFQDAADPGEVDIVLGQSPSAGKKLRRGDMVTILIGKAPTP